MKAASREALMWLNNLQGQDHVLHFGTSKASLTGVGVARNGSNAVQLVMKLARGSQYYWRVNVAVAGKVNYVGDEWSFTTI